jgi:alpha-beta hydrolase superfamily lysophospholipase
VADGYSVYAIEHRGHGRSSGPRALIDRIGNAVSDLDQLVVLAAGENPDMPVFLLGHSMGGAIAVSYALAHQDRLDGLVLSAPLAALEAAPPPGPTRPRRQASGQNRRGAGRGDRVVPAARARDHGANALMYGTADRLCPPQGSLMLSERIGSQDKVLKAYDGLYHEIFNEPERDRVLDDLCSWLAAHVPAGLAV